MAALVCIAYSIGVHFYRAGRVFISTRGSFTESLNYLCETRNQILEQRYLERLPSLYDNRVNNSENKDRCMEFTSNKVSMENDIQSSYDFISIESAVEATENYYRDVSFTKWCNHCEIQWTYYLCITNCISLRKMSIRVVRFIRQHRSIVDISSLGCFSFVSVIRLGAHEHSHVVRCCIYVAR